MNSKPFFFFPTLANMKSLFSVHFAFLALAIFCQQGNAQTNIIQIIADDMSWSDLSTGLTNLGNGSPYYQTPNIDALAAGGMSFTSFYAQPACAPTRAALLTGQYAPRNGLHNVGALNQNAASLLVGPDDGNSINTAAITIGETLQASGYVTAHIGKFHSTNRPNDIENFHGFDFNVGGTTSGGVDTVDPYLARLNNNGTQWSFGNAHGAELDIYAQPYSQQYIDQNLLALANGNNAATVLDSPKHLNDAMADATIDFLEDRTSDGQPFFVNVAFNAVHNIANSRSDLEAKYAGLPPSTIPQHDNPAYAGLLEGMDQAIGRIINFVNANGLSGNTLIVFMSDNGGTNVTDNYPLRGQKGSFQEGGIRVPLIFNLPGTIAPGVTDRATHLVDLYKTYAELTGAALPDPAVHPLDGESFNDTLAGNSTPRSEPIYYHFPGSAGQTRPQSVAICDGSDGKRYKLLYFYEDRIYEFYNLTDDIDESVELVSSGMTETQLEIAIACSQSLIHWLGDVDAELLTVRATGEAVPPPQHSVPIDFDLDESQLGSGLEGLASGVVSELGLSLTLTAQGQGGVLDTDDVGIGVSSDQDTGGNNQQRRINGSQATPEGIEFSFDQDVLLKHLNVNNLSSDGVESVHLEFVAGDNPFVGLSGYTTDGFTVTNNDLEFVRNDNSNNSLTVRFGRLAQSEILLTAGTTIRLTSNNTVNGGILLESIGVAFPQSDVVAAVLLGDVNRDEVVDFLDISPFIAVLSAGELQEEADIDRNGFVDFLDISPFIAILSAR